MTSRAATGGPIESLLAGFQAALANLPAPRELSRLIAATPRWFRILGGALVATIAVLTLGGAVEALFDLGTVFHISGEIDQGFRFSPVFSALLLAGATIACGVRVGQVRSGARAFAWGWLALLFAFMTADELFTIHEDVEASLGFDWQLVYLPLLLGSGLAWLVVVGGASERPLEVLLWLAGAAIWVTSRVIDTLEGKDADPSKFDIGHVWSGIEETGEMVGNACFLLAALLAVHAYRASRRPRSSTGD